MENPSQSVVGGFDMKEIEVEGFKVIIEKAEGKFIVSVPKLPGCTVQVDDEEDAAHEIRAMIGMYLTEVASRKLGPPRKEGGSGPKKGRGEGEPGPKIRK
jgi:predicted RNase H-like HicB family nuclease